MLNYKPVDSQKISFIKNMMELWIKRKLKSSSSEAFKKGMILTFMREPYTKYTLQQFKISLKEFNDLTDKIDLNNSFEVDTFINSFAHKIKFVQD